MRSGIRYLNGVLTVLAILLSLQLWTQWTAAPNGKPITLASEAHAAGGIPNAGAQRQQMVDLLKKVVQQNDKLIGMFNSGQARVKVESKDK